jgi:hypothetical protein
MKFLIFLWDVVVLSGLWVMGVGCGCGVGGFSSLALLFACFMPPYALCFLPLK